MAESAQGEHAARSECGDVEISPKESGLVPPEL